MSGPAASTSISPVELRRRLDAGEQLTLLDVREPAERQFCSIPHSADLFIPIREIPTRLDEIAAAPPPLVVYCHHGVRSEMARRWLAERGLSEIFNLDGGIDAYSHEADPSIPHYS